MINGDIDLTRNLDFYRKKPKKLLPANVKLSRPALREDKKYYLKYSSNNGNWSEWTISSNTVNINSTYTTTIDTYEYYPESSLYTDNNSVNSISISSSNSIGTTISSSTYTINFKYVNGWSDVANTVKKLPEKIFSLWKHVKKNFMKENSVRIVRCSRCNEEYMIVNDADSYRYHLCRKCNLMETAEEKMDRYMNGTFFRRKPINDYHKKYPWDNNMESRINRLAMISIKRESISRKIPWLRHLNSRIYNDYMDELKGIDKNYDDYLTNMGWIGVRRNNPEDEEDNVIETI